MNDGVEEREKGGTVRREGECCREESQMHDVKDTADRLSYGGRQATATGEEKKGEEEMRGPRAAWDARQERGSLGIGACMLGCSQEHSIYIYLCVRSATRSKQSFSTLFPCSANQRPKT